VGVLAGWGLLSNLKLSSVLSEEGVVVFKSYFRGIGV